MMGRSEMFVGCFLFVLVGGGLVTALVLLIVGGIKKIKVMWIIGAVVLGLTMLAVVGVAILAFVSGGVVRSRPLMGPIAIRQPAVPVLTVFEEMTGVPLPPGASQKFNTSEWIDGMMCEYIVLRVPRPQQPPLLANFSKTTLAAIRQDFGPPSDFGLPGGDWPAAFADAPCYTHSYTNAEGDRYRSWLVCFPGTEDIHVRINKLANTVQPRGRAIAGSAPSEDDAD